MPWFLSARRILNRLSAIDLGLSYLIRLAEQQKEITIMAQADIDRLKRIVAENTSVSNSIVTLVQGLSQQIREVADDPEEIRALADQLDADVRKVAAAVVANSQQSPEQPAPQPEPEQQQGEPVLDAEGNPVLDAEGNPTFKTQRRRSR